MMNQRQTIEAKAAEAERIGFYGKVPSHGDFVSGALAQKTQSVFDEWLRRSLGKLEEQDGEHWKARFLAAPPWRFVMGRGLCGPVPLAGVMLPSHDRVGRPFPLTIMAQMPAFAGPARELCFDTSWFTAAEAIAETSRLEDFDLADLVAALARLRLPRPRDDTKRIESAADQRSIWWTIDPNDGGQRGFMTDGLPAPDDFSRFIDPHPDARDEPAAPLSGVATAATLPALPPVEQSAPQNDDAAPLLETERPGAAASTLRLVHAHATHPGTRATINADALLVSETAGVFAVADGLTDAAPAAEAAKLTTHMLAGIVARPSLMECLQEIKGKLGRAHGLLQSAAPSRETAAASVAVLAIRDGEYAIVWAGNARCYQLRDGMMRPLTRDHVEIGLRRSVSRAIGAERQFVPEVMIAPVEPGDRFLLCSQPLTITLTDRQIAEILIEAPVADAAESLIQTALVGGARDNVSAIVIDAVGE